MEFDSRLLFTFPILTPIPLPLRSPMPVAGRRPRPGRAYPPKSFPLNLFAAPHPLTPIPSIFYKNIKEEGGLYRLGTPKNPSRIYLSFQSLAQCPSRNSFLLIIFHFQWGVGGMSFFAIRHSLPATHCPLSFHTLAYSFHRDGGWGRGLFSG